MAPADVVRRFASGVATDCLTVDRSGHCLTIDGNGNAVVLPCHCFASFFCLLTAVLSRDLTTRNWHVGAMGLGFGLPSLCVWFGSVGLVFICNHWISWNSAPNLDCNYQIESFKFRTSLILSWLGWLGLVWVGFDLKPSNQFELDAKFGLESPNWIVQIWQPVRIESLCIWSGWFGLVWFGLVWTLVWTFGWNFKPLNQFEFGAKLQPNFQIESNDQIWRQISQCQPLNRQLKLDWNQRLN